MKKPNHMDFLDQMTITVNDLSPLAKTMSDTLKQIGVTPPADLANLAAAFQQNVIAPISQVSSSPVGNQIVDFIREQVTAAANGANLSAVLQTVATGGNKAITQLSNQQQVGNFFSNPWVWVIVAMVIGIVILVAKYA